MRVNSRFARPKQAELIEIIVLRTKVCVFRLIDTPLPRRTRVCGAGFRSAKQSTSARPRGRDTCGCCKRAGPARGFVRSSRGRGPGTVTTRSRAGDGVRVAIGRRPWPPGRGPESSRRPPERVPGHEGRCEADRTPPGAGSKAAPLFRRCGLPIRFVNAAPLTRGPRRYGASSPATRSATSISPALSRYHSSGARARRRRNRSSPTCIVWPTANPCPDVRR